MQSVPFFLEEFYSIMSHREKWGAHTTDVYMQNKDAVMPPRAEPGYKYMLYLLIPMHVWEMRGQKVTKQIKRTH